DFQRPVADAVQLVADRQHVLGAHAGGQQGLVGVAQDGVGDGDFLAHGFSPLQARVGGNGGGDGQGQFARLAFDRVVQQLRVLVDEAGVEAAAAEVGIGENLLVIGGGGLHPLQT